MNTVEILKDRFYDNTEHGSVMVPTGVYSIEREGDKIIFVLTGYPAIASFEPQRKGQGTFLLDSNDRIKSGSPVTFRRTIAGDTEEFLKSDLCQEGHPDQRLRIHLEDLSS